MNKKFIATAAAASTLGGALAGATLLAPGQAGAQDGDDTTPAEETVRPEMGEHISTALQGLVDDGTLTESQVDAIVEALGAARPERSGEHGPRGDRGSRGGGEIAEILGLDQEALREAISSGQSLADVAAEQGVDTQDLIDAIVDAAEERVNSAVESGRIDQDKADEILANAADHAEDIVNGEAEFGRRGPGHGRGGFGGEGPPAGADA